ncbi:MAG: DUF4214 domain-containing protein [Epsilonproteobacteria bacterium]|nr:DUF4214 domain-containing protein [Campylobacterota bacterium]
MKKIWISTALSAILVTAINADVRSFGGFTSGHSSGSYSGSSSEGTHSSSGSQSSSGSASANQDGSGSSSGSTSAQHSNDGNSQGDQESDGGDMMKPHMPDNPANDHDDENEDNNGTMNPHMPDNPIKGGHESDFGKKEPPKKPQFEHAKEAPKAVMLQWSDETDNELGYKVYRDGELIAILPPNSTQFIDKNVEPGKEYTYEIKPFNDFGEGEGVETSVKTKEPHDRDKVENHFKDHLADFYNESVDPEKLNKMVEEYEEGKPLTDIYKKFFLKENKDLPNEEFVKELYKTLLDKEIDQSTLEDLVNKLKNAEITREELYYDVITSDEFKTKIQEEGIENPFEGDEEQEKEKVKKISEFVKRFYTELLDRNPEEGGYNYWERQLADKELSAKDIAKQFFDSEEFKSKNLSDEDFVKTVYKVIMGRDADQAGVDFWTQKLKEGMSRDDLVNQFLEAPEFENLAKNYDIEAKDPVKEFVSRFYTNALQRDADPNGTQYWAKELKDADKTAKEVAKEFFNSEEFKNLNLNDEEFIKTAYKTLLGRDADEAGLKYWKEQLQNGVSREELIDQFLDSEEFKKFAMESGVLVDKPSA